LTKIDLKQLVDNVLLTVSPLADKKSLALNVDCSAEVPAIRADGDKIEQALINIIGNAIKFTPPEGTINIDVHPMGNGPNDPGGVMGYVEISVADTGIGIPEEHRKHLFEKFYQVEDSLSQHKQGGTGLGLAISKGIVEAHGGQIWFESNEDKGSTFSFTLPIIDEEHACFALANELPNARLKGAPLSLLLLNVVDMGSILKAHKELDLEQVVSAIKRAIISYGIKVADKVEIAPPLNEVMLIAPDTDRAGAQALLRRIMRNINKEQAAVRDYSRSLITSIATYPEDGTTDKELIDFARAEIRKQMTV
jgi:hypothetical protein